MYWGTGLHVPTQKFYSFTIMRHGASSHFSNWICQIGTYSKRWYRCTVWWTKETQTNFEMIINLKCALCIYKTCLNCKTIYLFIKLLYIHIKFRTWYIKFRKSHLHCKITKLEINTFYHWALMAVAAPEGEPGERPPQHKFLELKEWESILRKFSQIFIKIFLKTFKIFN